MESKKVILIFLAITMLVAGSTVAWLYFADMPNKPSVGAKQVYLKSAEIVNYYE